MNKNEFLQRLSHQLAALSQQERARSIAFYQEMVDDRIEEGMTEEEAVASLGDVNDIAQQIINDTPPITKAINKTKTSSKSLNIILLIITFPIWFPLFFACGAAILSVFAAIWGLIIALFAVVAALLFGGFAVIVTAIYYTASVSMPVLLFGCGCGLVLISLAIFSCFGVVAITKGLANLTVRMFHGVCSWFHREKGVVK